MNEYSKCRWARWALLGCLTCCSVQGFAWSFSSHTEAPVEEAQAEGAGAPTTEASEVNEATSTAARPSYTSERTRWEDSPERSRGEHAKPAHETFASDSSVTVEQLSQQVNNIANMNLPGRIDELQQAVARLRGQVDTQQRTIQKLQAQLNARAISTTEKKSTHSKTVTPRIAPKSPVPASHAASGNDSQHAYSQAFDALMKKQYGTAKDGFLAYTHDYPSGTYVSNAYYWLAEIALVKRDYKTAQERLNTVITRYPSSSKYPDARYKLAMTHLKMHQTQKARGELQALSRDYAGKTVGRLASIALEQLDLDQ